MKVINKYNYRNAKEILEKKYPKILKETLNILNDSTKKIDLSAQGPQRNLSSQIQEWFVKKGWEKEKPSFSIKELRYDLVKDNIVIEIELGHQRLVYADFFEFMADCSKGHIDVAIMIVANEPEKFGHDWHNSLDSTKKKILAIKETFLVPVFVIAIDP